MCRLNPELTLAFTGCTLWHTALIAIHRYFVVVHGDAYHRISKRRLCSVVLIRIINVWVFLYRFSIC